MTRMRRLRLWRRRWRRRRRHCALLLAAWFDADVLVENVIVGDFADADAVIYAIVGGV